MSASAKNFKVRPGLTYMENIIVGIIAVLLFGYLFVAMIRPEKF